LTDRMFVENLHLRCRVGITPMERQKAQGIVVDATLFLSLEDAAEVDRIEATVNYKDVMGTISDFISNKDFNLIESVAEGVAALLLETFPVERARVRVRKEKYSSEPSVGVEVERGRA
jgi:dihydroneopterin aldolase